jgi:hypothetical protein
MMNKFFFTLKIKSPHNPITVGPGPQTPLSKKSLIYAGENASSFYEGYGTYSPINNPSLSSLLGERMFPCSCKKKQHF